MNTKRDVSQFKVGSGVAVHTLANKIISDSNPRLQRRQRLLEAANQAQAMYQMAQQHADPEGLAFYHGLLTGYAVALQLLEW
jgi:hypothetical protein